MHQAFFNVIKNAIESMPDGGIIQIEADQLDERNVRVRFKDHGIGIAEERLSTLGEPYYATSE